MGVIGGYRTVLKRVVYCCIEKLRECCCEVWRSHQSGGYDPLEPRCAEVAAVIAARICVREAAGVRAGDPPGVLAFSAGHHQRVPILIEEQSAPAALGDAIDLLGGGVGIGEMLEDTLCSTCIEGFRGAVHRLARLHREAGIGWNAPLVGLLDHGDTRIDSLGMTFGSNQRGDCTDIVACTATDIQNRHPSGDALSAIAGELIPLAQVGCDIQVGDQRLGVMRIDIGKIAAPCCRSLHERIDFASSGKTLQCQPLAGVDMKPFHLHPLLARIALCATMVATPIASSAAIPYPHIVKVTKCLASRGTALAPGYAFGYYPAGPYLWPDVYGNRYYQAPLRSNPTLRIDYTNATNRTIKEIEFGLVANGNLVAEVRDIGTFSPSIEIRHEFGLSPNVFPLRTALARCVPLRVTYADGARWTNPHLPALRHRIYDRP